MDSTTNKHSPWFYVGIVFSILTVIGVIVGTVIASKKANTVDPDQNSQNRLSILSQAFSSSLGIKWPWILITFSIFIIILLILLYLLSKQGLNFNIDDANYKIFLYTFITIIVIFTIFIVVLATKLFLDGKTKNETGDIPNYIPYQQSQTSNKIILGIVGLSIFILFAVSFAVYYFFFKK